LPTILAVLASFAGARAQQPTRPDVYLGHPLAADFVLPDWNAVRGYFERLDRESARVELHTVGKTTEGRDFVLAVISSEKNLAEIETLKRYTETPSRAPEGLRGGPGTEGSCAWKSYPRLLNLFMLAPGRRFCRP